MIFPSIEDPDNFQNSGSGSCLKLTIHRKMSDFCYCYFYSFQSWFKTVIWRSHNIKIEYCHFISENSGMIFWLFSLMFCSSRIWIQLFSGKVLDPQQWYLGKFYCAPCDKEHNSNFALKKHNEKEHPELVKKEHIKIN